MVKRALAGLSRRAWSRHAPVPPPKGATGASLQRHSLYILPTREGLYYGAMLAVTFVAAVNYANGLAYALTFLLAAVGVVAILHTYRNLVRLHVSAGPAPPVFAGEPARFTVVVHNEADMARYAVDLTLAAETRRVDVPAQGAATVELTLPTIRRGYLSAPPVQLRSRFPIGLWRAWSRPLKFPARCLVYPHPAPEQPFPDAPSAQATSGREFGRHLDGEELAGLREFRHGDPMQRVAWKKLAAGQGWHTKQFAAPAARLVWLGWDATPGLNVEQRLGLLCRWVLMAEQQGVAYGLQLPGVAISPATGAMHRDRCLERLALFEPPP